LVAFPAKLELSLSKHPALVNTPQKTEIASRLPLGARISCFNRGGKIMDWKNSIGEITAIVVGIGGLLAAIWFAWGKWEKIWKNILNPLWKKMIKPILKFMIVAITLVVPNGLIIGFLLYRVALFYWEIRRVDFIITNQAVFIQLVALQTVLVSLYSYLWFILFFSKLRDWLFGQK
jgi:hypothetical protein